MAAKETLPNFTRASPNVLLSNNGAEVYPNPADTPDLILINAWMGAALKHILKYTSKYAILYPTARIVVTTNQVIDFAWRSDAENKKNLQPAVDAIRSATATCTPNKPKILMHSFSNGGNHNAVLIASTYRAQVGEPLPVTAVVMDSAPGRARYQGGILAAKASLPRFPPLYWLGVALAHIIQSVSFLLRLVFRRQDKFERLRRQLNDPELFSKSAPRTYIYSKKDDVVYWRDIEDHVEESQKLAWSVETLKLDGSPHVAHAMMYGDKYWDAVQGCWDRGMKSYQRPTEIDQVVRE